MHATLHQIDGNPGPQDTSWVDEVLRALNAVAPPAGALVMRPLVPGPCFLLALWDDAADTAAAAPGLGATGAVTVGPGKTYEIDWRKAGMLTRPARYLQLLTFDGPRSPEWTAAYARAGAQRIEPAVRDIPGLVEHIGGRAADGSCFSAALAESVETLEACAVAIMSTELLPGEDPVHLTGPDSVTILRLLHADLPVGTSR
jgi:hypothetical protein